MGKLLQIRHKIIKRLDEILGWKDFSLLSTSQQSGPATMFPLLFTLFVCLGGILFGFLFCFVFVFVFRFFIASLFSHQSIFSHFQWPYVIFQLNSVSIIKEQFRSRFDKFWKEIFDMFKLLEWLTSERILHVILQVIISRRNICRIHHKWKNYLYHRWSFTAWCLYE